MFFRVNRFIFLNALDNHFQKPDKMTFQINFLNGQTPSSTKNSEDNKFYKRFA